jgi:hypothetical protein
MTLSACSLSRFGLVGTTQRRGSEAANPILMRDALERAAQFR